MLKAQVASPFLTPPVPVATDWAPHSIALGDVNGDGRLDAVTANWPAASASVLVGNGDGTFQSPVNYPVGANPIHVALGDLNGDGFLDAVLALSAGAAKGTAILAGRGDGTFADAMLVSGDNIVERVAIADPNEDGRGDLVERGRSAGGTSTLGVRLNTTDYPDPAVTTGVAAGVAEDAATLTGTIVSRGLPSRWRFEYGRPTPTARVRRRSPWPRGRRRRRRRSEAWHRGRIPLPVGGRRAGLRLLGGRRCHADDPRAPVRRADQGTSAVRWRLGKASGTVTVRGTLSAGANLRLQLLRLQGKQAKLVATLNTLKPGGPFTATIRVPKSMLPGRFRVQASGLSGSRPLVPRRAS